MFALSCSWTLSLPSGAENRTDDNCCCASKTCWTKSTLPLLLPAVPPVKLPACRCWIVLWSWPTPFGDGKIFDEICCCNDCACSCSGDGCCCCCDASVNCDKLTTVPSDCKASLDWASLVWNCAACCSSASLPDSWLEAETAGKVPGCEMSCVWIVVRVSGLYALGWSCCWFSFSEGKWDDDGDEKNEFPAMLEIVSKACWVDPTVFVV